MRKLNRPTKPEMEEKEQENTYIVNRCLQREIFLLGQPKMFNLWRCSAYVYDQILVFNVWRISVPRGGQHTTCSPYRDALLMVVFTLWLLLNSQTTYASNAVVVFN